jgi:hypothetical protein
LTQGIHKAYRVELIVLVVKEYRSNHSRKQREKPMGRIMFLASLALFCAQVSAWAAPQPIVTDATDGILKAFQTHPLVGIAEAHGLAQELDYYATLISDPRFASEVGNIVLEMGDAAYQDVADRYVNGENVPHVELRKVWADTYGVSPTVFPIGSINVYSIVRSVNLKLPPDKRIKIWLGGPPIVWSKITTKADLASLSGLRDSFPAELLQREIIARNKKALVIFGAGHLQQGPFADKNNLLVLVNRARSGAFFVVWLYLGYATKSCEDRFAVHTTAWPTPALVEGIRGSALEADILPPGCGIIDRPANMTPQEFEELMRDYVGLTSDGLLYLGPRSEHVCSPADPDIYLDLDFRAELDRRNEIRSGKPITGFTAAENTATPKPFWPTGQCTFRPR